MKLLKFTLLLISISFLSGCFTIENRYTGFAPGPWRATLDVNTFSDAPPAIESTEEEAYNFEDTPPNHLPFNFEVKYIDEANFYIELQNGEERIQIKDIQIGRDRRTNRDTFLIEFPVFNSYIKGIFMERIMEGEWVDKNRTNYSLPFAAWFGRDHRFSRLKETTPLEVGGTWEVEFVDEGGPYPGIAEFQQVGNQVTGTFLTETGDYRYLEGNVVDNRLYLSVFDGAHAFLFEAKPLADGSLIGSFKSGNHYKATWTATRNEKAVLADPTSLTYMKEPTTPLSFSFENADGQLVSLDDAPYQGKVKLIQIFGTWCPNCRDETEFLVDYFKKNPMDEVAVIGLAFEKRKESDQAKERLRIYKERMDIPYELLLAGESDATSKYQDFVIDFDQTMKELVASD